MWEVVLKSGCSLRWHGQNNCPSLGRCLVPRHPPWPRCVVRAVHSVFELTQAPRSKQPARMLETCEARDWNSTRLRLKTTNPSGAYKFTLALVELTGTKCFRPPRLNVKPRLAPEA